MTETSKLWAIHIPGPDDFHAAPSEAAAHHMAEKHNATMDEYLANRAELFDSAHGVPRGSVMAVVAEWPGTATNHAKWLKEFEYEAWGLKAGAA
ncbi:MAG: hypothetical protein V4772_08835 [Pseudomonadota bacterium]